MRWILAGLCYAAFAAWAIAAAWLIRNQGDMMISFHPVILAILPGIIVGAFSSIILFVCRQWWIGTALILGVLTLFLVVRNGRAIEERAWERTIELHAESNAKALASIQGDLPGDDLMLLWEEANLSPLPDFKWYGSNHFSAPDGVYFGFGIGGVPHVRIQKIRHGWRGVALIRREVELASLVARTGMGYSRVGTGDWYVWIMD